MKIKTIILILQCIWSYFLPAQTLEKLDYSCAFRSSELLFEGERVSGISGIEYSGEGNLYYAVSDLSPAHYYIFDIQTSNCKIEVKEKVVLIAHPEDTTRPESIRFHLKTKEIYLVTEEDQASRLLVFSPEAKMLFQQINPRDNSGFEGLTFSPNGERLFIGIEGFPKVGCKKQQYTQLIAYNPSSGVERRIQYPVTKIKHDKHRVNGVTEILAFDNSTLLFLERAYLGKRRGVTTGIFKATIPPEESKFITNKQQLFSSKSLPFQIDNAEGMTWNADKKYLIVVTDNNGRTRQETQIIVLKVE